MATEGKVMGLYILTGGRRGGGFGRLFSEAGKRKKRERRITTGWGNL